MPKHINLQHFYYSKCSRTRIAPAPVIIVGSMIFANHQKRRCLMRSFAGKRKSSLATTSTRRSYKTAKFSRKFLLNEAIYDLEVQNCREFRKNTSVLAQTVSRERSGMESQEKTIVSGSSPPYRARSPFRPHPSPRNSPSRPEEDSWRMSCRSLP